jgi:hypothetical protein
VVSLWTPDGEETGRKIIEIIGKSLGISFWDGREVCTGAGGKFALEAQVDMWDACKCARCRNTVPSATNQRAHRRWAQATIHMLTNNKSHGG